MEERHGQFQIKQDRKVLDARILARFREHLNNPEYSLPYTELSALLGTDIRRDTNVSAKVTDSMKYVERELGIKLGRDRVKRAIVRLQPDQYVTAAESSTKKIRRAAKRASHEASRLAQLDDVTDDVRNKLYAQASLNGALAAFCGKASVQRIERAAGTTGEPMPLRKTLEAFQNKTA